MRDLSAAGFAARELMTTKISKISVIVNLFLQIKLNERSIKTMNE